MSLDQRNMFSGLLALESAALAASVATWGRFAGFALERAGVAASAACETLSAAPGARERALDQALLRSWELDVDVARVMASLPRLWLILFLGELDRARGPRHVHRATGPSGTAASGLVSVG